jgi:cell division protein FtsA
MENRDFDPNSLVFALDIGTTKICLLAGRFNDDSRLEVIATQKVVSQGVSRGIVSNINKTTEAIQEVAIAMEKKLGVKISTINVGIAGSSVKSILHNESFLREYPAREITKEEIDSLTEKVRKISIPLGHYLLHIIPQEYTVDSDRDIIDPIGMIGTRVAGNFNVITVDQNSAINISKSIEKAGYRVGSITLEPIASCEATVTPKEKHAGVALIDIGGGTTDLAVFENGLLRYSSVLPLGGNAVTKDIMSAFSLLESQAEELKLNHGNLLCGKSLPSDFLISIAPELEGQDVKHVLASDLAAVIEARMEEIFIEIKKEIDNRGYIDLNAGIVLSGGGSWLKGIKDLAAEILACNARIGNPTTNIGSGYSKELVNPIYSTGIGLLKSGKPSINIKEVDLGDLPDNSSNDENFDKPKNDEPKKGGFFDIIKRLFDEPE